MEKFTYFLDFLANYVKITFIEMEKNFIFPKIYIG